MCVQWLVWLSRGTPPTPAGSRETPSAPGLQKPQDALLSLVLKGLIGPRAPAGLGGCPPVSWDRLASHLLSDA